MTTTIYYFTGTGNSLSVARKIGEGLDKVEIKSIPKAMKQKDFSSKSERIGIIYPVIAWGAPLIVDDFLSKFQFTKDQYIFTIATCGGTPAGSNVLLNRIIKKKGARISAGYVLKSGVYPISNSPDVAPVKMAKTLAGKSRQSIRNIDQRLDEIIDNTKHKKEVKLEGSNLITDLYGNMLHKQVIKVFKSEGKKFWVDEKCNACGVCKKICPSNNIQISKDGKHTWENNCQACYGCFHWCPNSAIQYNNVSKPIKRQHNLEIKLDDMLD